MTGHNYFAQDIEINKEIIKSCLDDTRDILVKGGRTPPVFHRQRQKELADLSDRLAESIQRCDNINYMTGLMEESANEAVQTALCDYAKLLLSDERRRNRPIICVFAPMFSSVNITDGFYRRIRNIDALLPQRTLRIHFCRNPQAHWARLTVPDDDHLLVEYEHADQVAQIFKLIGDRTRCAYCHSIHYYDADLLASCDIKMILDFHGAVPEESHMINQDEKRFEALTAAEKKAVERASVIIAVSNSMVDHIKKKYPQESRDADYLVVPIFDAKHICIGGSKKTERKRPVVIYAGGTQVWQLIDEMIQAVAAQSRQYSFRFFLPDPTVLEGAWPAGTEPSDLVVGTKSPEELRLDYAESDFGFILRDDSTVNRVACPTKLIEYLAYGIIPIVKFSGIGDFESDGMAYISIDDFIAGNIPGFSERQVMIEANYRTAFRQLKSFEQGRDELRSLFVKLLR